MVKVASETVSAPKFYERYFALVDLFLPQEVKKTAHIPEQPKAELGVPEPKVAPAAEKVQAPKEEPVAPAVSTPVTPPPEPAPIAPQAEPNPTPAPASTTPDLPPPTEAIPPLPTPAQ